MIVRGTLGEVAAVDPPGSGIVVPALGQSNILVPDEHAVARHLAAHGDLAKQLPALCAHARQQLGAAVELSLELYRDPEIDDEFLTLFVRQETYDLSLENRIDAAREAPEFSASAGRLLLTTDFRSPRGNACPSSGKN